MQHEQKFLESILARHPEMDLEEAQKLAYRTEQKRQRYVRLSGKTCRLCSTFKRLSEYGTNAENEDALEIICKECAENITINANEEPPETVANKGESGSFPTVALSISSGQNKGVTEIPYDPTAQSIFSSSRWYDEGNRWL
jgi:hypothetical protein